MELGAMALFNPTNGTLELHHIVEKLFDMAREWMRAAMEREDARKTTPRSRGYEASEKVKSSELCPRVI
jgi:hypothetical protein